MTEAHGTQQVAQQLRIPLQDLIKAPSTSSVCERLTHHMVMAMQVHPLPRETLTTRPDPPTHLTVSVTQTTADLSWTAPTDDGGSPITEYQYRFTTGTSVGGTWSGYR